MLLKTLIIFTLLLPTGAFSAKIDLNTSPAANNNLLILHKLKNAESHKHLFVFNRATQLHSFFIPPKAEKASKLITSASTIIDRETTIHNKKKNGLYSEDEFYQFVTGFIAENSLNNSIHLLKDAKSRIESVEQIVTNSIEELEIIHSLSGLYSADSPYQLFTYYQPQSEYSQTRLESPSLSNTDYSSYNDELIDTSILRTLGGLFSFKGFIIITFGFIAIGLIFRSIRFVMLRNPY